ncbi:MAG: pyruvate, phosphate dikinase [Actinophytocola sp.]|nr:pyruvate, phosphate dikinase [Actinophytocola sp.]
MTMTEAQVDVVELDGSCPLSRDQIGGKAWSINRMRALGLPVPPAFVITTGACVEFYARGQVIADDLWQRVRQGIGVLERELGGTFGSGMDPLLVSVRSGAPVSMPGMMDTILNLGMSPDVERALATGDPAYAADTRRRFEKQYRAIVLGDPGADVPYDPWQQLRAAIAAVFTSWRSARATTYRRSRGVDDTLGTAVTVQAMVFGNRDARSGTGVLFSRNPNTGESRAWGEWLAGGQGEDVVSGRTTPARLDELATVLPDVHRRLLDATTVLEHDGRDVQDVEFTVESGRLWLLQSRAAKRSARAALRAAVAMADEGLISEQDALGRLSAEQVRTVLRPSFDGVPDGEPVVRGEPACPGSASGIVVTDPDEADRRGNAGEDVVLVRPTTSPDDLHGMIGARAVVTELGGATSHAAVVSRELGRPCVVACGAGTVAALAGREVTVDGTSGAVWPGRFTGTAVDEAVLADLRRIAEWAGVAFRGTGSELLAALEPAPAAPSGQHAASELAVLRLIVIKGRTTVDVIAASLGADVAEVRAHAEALVAAEHCVEAATGLRATPHGRQHLTTLLERERVHVDADALAAAYEEFCEHNAELKDVITTWQLKDGATPNDHEDAAYDAQVLARLEELHQRVAPLLKRIGGLAPRLARYLDRLDLALNKINDGDHAWVARPIMDSYHTVWFELHEDLIALSGLTRADEAAAGRAQ